MTSIQRVIKYFAVALAICITISIIAGIFSVLFGITGGFGNMNNVSGRTVTRTEQFVDVKALDIKSGFASLTIQTGDQFMVEAFDIPESAVIDLNSDGTLIVQVQSNTGWLDRLFSGEGWFHDGTPKIVITLKEDFVAEWAKLDTSSGSVRIDKIATNKLVIDSGSGSLYANLLDADSTYFDAGSGSINIEKLNTGKTSISSSSGSFTVQDGELGELDLESGSGRVSIRGSIAGNIDLDSGSGSVSLDLLQAQYTDYDIVLDDGSGGLWINGEKQRSEDQIDNNGVYRMQIESGSGRVTINFQ